MNVVGGSGGRGGGVKGACPCTLLVHPKKRRKKKRIMEKGRNGEKQKEVRFYLTIIYDEIDLNLIWMLRKFKKFLGEAPWSWSPVRPPSLFEMSGFTYDKSELLIHISVLCLSQIPLDNRERKKLQPNEPAMSWVLKVCQFFHLVSKSENVIIKKNSHAPSFPTVPPAEDCMMRHIWGIISFEF